MQLNTNDEQNSEYVAILRCPMDGRNGCQAATVGEYLSLLLSTLWLQGEGFSGKRPFGDSGWEYEIYAALAEDGLIDGVVFDGDGYVEDFPEAARIEADEKILQAIRLMRHIDSSGA